jgi:hypothetical protein
MCVCYIALRKNKNYEWKFPKFGDSPMSTPTSTRSASLESLNILEAEVVAKLVITKDQATDPIPELAEKIVEIPKKFSSIRKKVDNEEMERKLRERMPIKFQESDLKNAKIDSRKLIDQGLPAQLSNRPTQVKDTKTGQTKTDTRHVYKRPAKKVNKPARQKQFLTIKEIKLSSNNQSFDEHSQRSSRLPSLKTEEDSEIREFRLRRKRDSITSIDGTQKSLLKKSSFRVDEDDESDFEEEFLKKNENLKSKNDQHQKPTTVFNSYKTVEDKPPLPSVKTDNNKISHQPIQSNQSLKRYSLSRLKDEMRDVKSVLRTVDSAENIDNTDSGQIVPIKVFSRRSDQTRTSYSVLSELDSNFSDNWNSVSRLQEKKDKPEKIKKIEYSEKEIKQISNLFSYFYGVNGPPKRINSANYAVTRINNSKTEAVEFVDSTRTELVKINNIIKKKQESNRTVTSYFDTLLDKYETKRNKLNERAKSAQIRRDIIQDESLKKWSASIEKKSKTKQQPLIDSGLSNEQPGSNFKLVDVTFGDQSLLNRDINTSSILSKRKSANKRPKSVSFSDGKLEPSNDNVQPAYLISTIEMEEILQEAAARAIYRSRSRSSVTTIPSIYFKHLKTIQTKVPTQANPFDNNNIQESMDRIFTTSATDSSDDEDDDSICVTDDETLKNGRSTNSSINRKNTPSTMTFDSQNRVKNSTKNLRINSCIVDYRSSAAKKNLGKDTSKFESLSSYRQVTFLCLN